ncbi:hypothetical protein MKW94_001604 [Papaver nudicaule]|uniref:RING-type domain-containing protein n=1 Tax=Papaver nudicaule TaxID=74823 RepID=A0AA41VWM0_PAPNU|nr:hypothetical protein [Papaver nudicaule]
MSSTENATYVTDEDSATDEENATDELEPATKKDIAMRIKSIDTITTENRVENPYEETRAFVEVQIRERNHMYQARSSILFDLISGKYLDAREKKKPTTVKLFQISFADLFSSDVFRNCDLDPLLSLGSLENSPAERRFWNFFKHAVSAIGKKSAKLNLLEKKSVLILVVKLEIFLIAKGAEVGKENHMLDDYLFILRSEFNKHVCKREGIVDCNLYEDGVQMTSMLKTFYAKSFNKDTSGDAKEECVICLDEFKGVNSNVMELYCGHVLHNQCILKWINQTEPPSVCPVCRHPLNPFPFDT